MLKYPPTAEQIANIRVERFVPIFKEELKRSSVDCDSNAFPIKGCLAKFLEPVNDPTIVIRKPESRYSETKSQVIRTCRIMQKLVRELNDVYDIPAKAQFIVASDSGGRVTFCAITDKVQVQNLDNLSKREKNDAIAELEWVFETLLTYLERKIQGREYYLAEIFDHNQFVYGISAARPTRRWHLVDLDPIYSKSRSFLRHMLGPTDETIGWMEERLGVAFPDLRERHAAFRKSLLPRRKK